MMKMNDKMLSTIARLQSRVGLAALNPQPLPPSQIGAKLAEGYTQSVMMRLTGGNGDSQGNDIDQLDIWCPLGVRRQIPFKLPPWWRRFDQEAFALETANAIQLSFAARLHEIAALCDDKALNKRLNVAVETVIDAVQQNLG